jgi:hypothetical protein
MSNIDAAQQSGLASEALEGHPVQGPLERAVGFQIHRNRREGPSRRTSAEHV